MQKIGTTLEQVPHYFASNFIEQWELEQLEAQVQTPVQDKVTPKEKCQKRISNSVSNVLNLQQELENISQRDNSLNLPASSLNAY